MNDARFRHMPFLDGFRAVAITMVMAWHASGIYTIRYTRRFETWVGVDAFFVLSGFLITSLLVQERKDHGSFSLGNFYARRVLRISPAYYVFLLSMALYYGRPALRALALCAVYLSNYDHGYRWGFFASYPGGTFEAVVPMWSLSIEEQFYLFWPLLLSLLGHRDDEDPLRFPRAQGSSRCVAVAAIFLCRARAPDPRPGDRRQADLLLLRDPRRLDPHRRLRRARVGEPPAPTADPRGARGGVDPVDRRRRPVLRGPERCGPTTTSTSPRAWWPGWSRSRSSRCSSRR